jgi:hypothetical protein
MMICARRKPMVRLAVALGGALVVMCVGSAAAEATGIHCGEVITHSVTATNDISCPSAGLFVSGDGITVNLNGHTIRSSTASNHSAGISVQASSITLKNGTVRGYRADGVFLSGASNRVTGMKLLDNDTGIFVDLHGNTVEYSTVSGPCEGIVLNRGASGNTVDHNHVSVAGSCTSGPDRNGIDLVDDGGNNTISFNSTTGGQNGIRVVHGSSSDLLHRNTVSGAGDGIFTSAAGPSAAGVHLSSNRATHNSIAGFGAFWGSPTYDGNVAQLNETGFALRDTTGAVLRNNIAGNATSLSTMERKGNDASGFVLGVGSVFVGNSANYNVADGVLIPPEAGTDDVRSTIAAHNGLNGIRDQSSGSTFTANRASFNGGFGITAGLGAVDGGGNVAYRNAAGQCSNLSC